MQLPPVVLHLPERRVRRQGSPAGRWNEASGLPVVPCLTFQNPSFGKAVNLAPIPGEGTETTPFQFFLFHSTEFA